MSRKRKQSQTQDSENVANVSNIEPQENLGVNDGPLKQATSTRNRTPTVNCDPSTSNGCSSSRFLDPLAQGRRKASRRPNSSPSLSRQKPVSRRERKLYSLQIQLRIVGDRLLKATAFMKKIYGLQWTKKLLLNSDRGVCFVYLILAYGLSM